MASLAQSFADAEALEEFMTAPTPALVRDLAGLAGGLYPCVQAYITPGVFDFVKSM